MTEEQKFEVTDTEMTPNPNAFKYILNQPVIRAGTRSYASEEEAENDPFAKAVFALGPVESLYLQENFVTVTFQSDPQLDILVEAAEEVIEEYLHFFDQDAEKKNSDSILERMDEIDFPSLSDAEKGAVIDAVFDETVRPALAQDGGGITILDYQDNTLRIRYQGACGSCPSSATGTLRAIQNILRQTVKQEIRVMIASA